MSLEFTSDLVKDISSLLHNADDFNVIIQVGEGQNTKKFHVHSVILRARSPYFKIAFSTNWIQKTNNTIMFNKPNITSFVFDMILMYIYSGELNLASYSDQNIFELLIASDELLLEELTAFAQDNLIKRRTTWIKNNITLQTPGLIEISNISEWYQGNFEELKKTLSHFIPLIRFAEISPEDFYDKVRPYKASIANHIYEEIEKFYYKKTLPKTANLLPRSKEIKPKSFMEKMIAFIFCKDSTIYSDLSKDLSLILSIINLSKQPSDKIFELLIASDELLLEELFKQVLDYLFENHVRWIQKNFVFVLNGVIRLARFKKLQDYCFESICSNPLPFMTSKNFTSLDKSILFGLLESEDLALEEIDAWNFLIKWSIEQTPELSGNINEWNQGNFEELKKTLSKFIPLIRFVKISSDDFYDEVRPYKAAFPNHIYEEIEKFYYKRTLPKSIVLSSRVGNIISEIINPNLKSLIANWIDKTSKVLLYNNNYKFDLMYLKSRDGINRAVCNCNGPFVLLIKDQSQKIFGGYNPTGYNSATSLPEKESFIFSFENGQRTYNMKIGNYIRSKKADKIPLFFNFGNHLCINVKAKKLLFKDNGNYEYIFDDIKDNLRIKEIGIFKLKKTLCKFIPLIRFEEISLDEFFEEIDIWDCLIKWGIENSPGLGSKEFEALEKTISQFIYLNGVEISPEDFFDKVCPYKVAIPNHIYEEVEEFHY
ncbi:17301_t:CDS:2 [Funneliformis geosporum]|uniref:17301_t:CDS:1 n=1 Tax=Funneliformis geosporum TaxID=1117311 RepID=A0A9W4SF06_9GLOM|nr:17301_t:CDS:2 [Funneliformis geosporum]